MNKIVYYVATTLDGYICAKNGSIDGFSQDKNFVKHYKESLDRYSCAIMGKATYEFGFQFGLQPGRKAYPHMEHYIFSKSIELPEDSEVTAVRGDWKQKLKGLKSESKTDIYLCGGSEFAGFVLEAGLIDELILKTNPFMLGEGKPIFASKKQVSLETISSKQFDCGIIESRYKIVGE